MSHPFQLNQFKVGVPPTWPPSVPTLWFLFWENRLLVQQSAPQAEQLSKAEVLCAQLPQTQDFMALGLQILGSKPGKPLQQNASLWNEVGQRSQFLGFLQQQPCYALDLSAQSDLWEHPSGNRQNIQSDQLIPPELQPGYQFCGLKHLYGALPESQFAIAGRAVQLLSWERNHRFCGHCGTALQQRFKQQKASQKISSEPTSKTGASGSSSGSTKRCPSCGLRHYPRLSPAVIVRVTRGDEILLARSPRFRPGMYSVLAGFVEPGESLEDTVEREVKEEVGITLKNIRYFGSQPWPFPNSLMLAFTAEYARGELVPEPGEIEDVAWFSRSSLPPVPGPLSIARRLIDDFSQ